MGSWHPNDLVSDADLLAYESGILTAFGKADWDDKRVKALEDWLGPILRTQGFALERLRTRYQATAIWGYTASAYSDLQGAASDTATDDLDLAAIFATPANDALYIGSTEPFRGLSVRMLDSVSAVTASLSVKFWDDGWVDLSIVDGTQKATGKAFSGGGAVLWRVPAGWTQRTINGSDRLYWVKVTISATPTSAKASQIGVIRRSCLAAPATFRTLALIMTEAPTKGGGPWDEKRERYAAEAEAALERALQICGGEFEAEESQDDLLDVTEAAQTVEEVGGGWRLERG